MIGRSNYTYERYLAGNKTLKEEGTLLTDSEAKALDDRLASEISDDDQPSTFQKVADFLQRNVTPDKVARAIDLYRMFMSGARAGQDVNSARLGGTYRALLDTEQQLDDTVRLNLRNMAEHDLKYPRSSENNQVYHRDVQFVFDAMNNAFQQRD